MPHSHKPVEQFVLIRKAAFTNLDLFTLEADFLKYLFELVGGGFRPEYEQISVLVAQFAFPMAKGIQEGLVDLTNYLSTEYLTTLAPFPLLYVFGEEARVLEKVLVQVLQQLKGPQRSSERRVTLSVACSLGSPIPHASSSIQKLICGALEPSRVVRNSPFVQEKAVFPIGVLIIPDNMSRFWREMARENLGIGLPAILFLPVLEERVENQVQWLKRARDEMSLTEALMLYSFETEQYRLNMDLPWCPFDASFDRSEEEEECRVEEEGEELDALEDSDCVGGLVDEDEDVADLIEFMCG